MPRHLFLCSLLLLAGCTKESRIRVDSQYLSRESLASYHVRTPDPRLNCPPVGQQLLLSWDFPKKWMKYDDLVITFRIRFGNYEEETVRLRPKRSGGMYCYRLLNEQYFSRCGIAAYKATLTAGGCPLAEWRHQLWVELITLHDEESEDESEEGEGLDNTDSSETLTEDGWLLR